MRRIYHRFPPRCDLNFDIDRPFEHVIRALIGMDNTHTTSHKGADLVKLQYSVSIAENKINFIPAAGLEEIADSISEAADFRIILAETLLTPQKRIPLSENRFLVRVNDAGSSCECFAVKENSHGEMDAFTLRQIIKDACE